MVKKFWFLVQRLGGTSQTFLKIDSSVSLCPTLISPPTERQPLKIHPFSSSPQQRSASTRTEHERKVKKVFALSLSPTCWRGNLRGLVHLSRLSRWDLLSRPDVYTALNARVTVKLRSHFPPHIFCLEVNVRFGKYRLFFCFQDASFVDIPSAVVQAMSLFCSEWGRNIAQLTPFLKISQYVLRFIPFQHGSFDFYLCPPMSWQ